MGAHELTEQGHQVFVQTRAVLRSQILDEEDVDVAPKLVGILKGRSPGRDGTPTARNRTCGRTRRTAGTRWTNTQMLWHMVLGYLIVWRLLPGVRLLGRLPDGYSRRFAAVLNAGTRPFHVINYLGGCAGALVFHGPRLTRLLDRTVTKLHRRLDAESEVSLGVGMHFPVQWDPFFADRMTVADVYHYGTQHYDFHRAQLTLASGKP